MKPTISFIVQYPSSDIRHSHEGPIIHATGAVHDLDEIADQLNFGIPSHVLQMVRRAFETDYRAEIILGGVEYKFYRKPSRDLVPKEEDNTLLERWQNINKPGSTCLGGDCPAAPRQKGIATNYCIECPNRKTCPREVCECGHPFSDGLCIGPHEK